MIYITCYIVNFNAKEYLIPCIKSTIEATKAMDIVEICVVDNASSDGSIEAVKNTFGDDIRVISNIENKGGAGGFNTALRDAIDKNRKYALLLDNDILVDSECLKHLISYMESNECVGAVGPKILIMDQPDFIQEFGGHLDMDHYYFKTDYWYEADNIEESEIECDWLSSCTLGVRIDAVKKTNLFPEENFLYWDDIQFTWEIKKAGYRLIALSSAKVWHKGKKKEVTNTASAYYAMRNRTKFFSICEKSENLDKLCRSLLGEYFDILFGSSLKGLKNTNSSRMIALDDFVHKSYGKIPDKALFELERISPEFESSNVEYVQCDHITKICENILPKIWVDKYLNKIVTEEDYKRVQAYPYTKEMFIDLHYEWLMQGIVAERKRYICN